MSIAFHRSSGNSVQRSAFIVHDMPSFLGAFQGDRRFPVAEDDDDSSSSSSIGRNSDLSSDGEDSGEEFEVSEVQSLYKGPLDTMAALEEVLPIKRGMSKFYSGKSKSFTSLADASSASSVRDLAKPENPYTKKRKNLLARGNVWDDQSRALPSKNDASCTSKKPSISNQSALNHRCPINYSKSSNIMEESESRSSSPSSSRPPLHPRAKPTHVYGSCSSPPRRNSPWRSFSFSDLQSAAGNCND
ncbi:protein OXIDATIVE STRESS 3 LIKE 1-like [Euphorbia lathyris]|uniref:protein OXIDATIVE STRESS 3 LIKE 1-like n=1 Tax=Euphorbia lathyris TaxID=212925 RepID=UPI0033141789